MQFFCKLILQQNLTIMKARTIILTGIYFLIATSFVVAQNVEKTLVKSFNLKGAEAIYLNVEGDVDVVQWDNKYLRVQMTIELKNSNNQILKSLISARRYNLEANYTDAGVSIAVPGLEKNVMIKGVKLNEYISYTIMAPRNTTVTIENGQLSVTKNEKEAL